jgi:hypothetical protein
MFVESAGWNHIELMFIINFIAVFCSSILDDADEFEDEHEVEHEQNDQMSLAQMLNHHREDDDYYGGYEYDEY